MSEMGPACVKTRASRECAELFSPFSSFDCDCQCCSFPIGWRQSERSRQGTIGSVKTPFIMQARNYRLLARLRHAIELSECPLIGVDPKSSAEGKNVAFDPGTDITDLFRYRYLSCYDGLREGQA